MWLRLVRLAPGASLEIPLSGYRITPGGISQNPDRCRDGMLRILEKLGASGAWRGRRALRNKAYSYVNHACSSIYSDRGRHLMALACVLKSFAWYPFPYRADEVVVPRERTKRLAVIALRLLRLRPHRRESTTGGYFSVEGATA
jgi:hypothetical protein